jgi:hypothetical protein
MERLGQIVAFVSVIKFQKRGLPHLHLMLTLDPNGPPSTPEEIDRLVSAELPDLKKEPILHGMVSEFNVHGPCKNYACWNGTNCSYGYPKPFTPRNVIIDGAFPAYLRRDDGQTIQKGATIFSNSNIVPYNKFLTLMFECHITVEVPVNSTAIKYVYKYITNGHNCLYIAVDVADETEAFVNGQYISAPEGESLWSEGEGIGIETNTVG